MSTFPVVPPQYPLPPAETKPFLPNTGRIMIFPAKNGYQVKTISGDYFVAETVDGLCDVIKQILVEQKLST